MMYEAYEKKIRGYLPLARILKICAKCAVLLLILGAVLLLGYFSLRGIHFGSYTLQSESVAFGDKPDFDCFVLLGTYKCEYARFGTQDWSQEQPTAPGLYSVRAVITKGFFGKKIYSEAGAIKIYRRDVTLRPEGKSSKAEYGEDPVFGKHWQISSSLLAKGHKVDTAALTYYTYDGHGGAICHIDPSSVVIRDRKGNDVTAGYQLSFSQGTISIKAKQITVVVANEIKNGKPVNITKTYDGQSASTSKFKVTKGNLYSGDQIIVTPHSVSADVGKHDNRVTVTVTNRAGQDRTAYYNIKVDVCKVVIEKRKISVKTPDVTLEYTGDGPLPLHVHFYCRSDGIPQSVLFPVPYQTVPLPLQSHPQYHIRHREYGRYQSTHEACRYTPRHRKSLPTAQRSFRFHCLFQPWFPMQSKPWFLLSVPRLSPLLSVRYLHPLPHPHENPDEAQVHYSPWLRYV